MLLLPLPTLCQPVVSAVQENNIGQDFALYYLAYAAYMELRGSFAKADAIFQSGLARYATRCQQTHVLVRVCTCAYCSSYTLQHAGSMQASPSH